MGGKVVDVSARKEFRQLYVTAMESAGSRCTEGTSGDERNGARPGTWPRPPG